MEEELKIQLDTVRYFEMNASSVYISLLEQFRDDVKEKYVVTDLIRKSDGKYLIELKERVSN